jgi:SWI/SNF-related matrix-associated actin-dependent regulator of chromatin subfamily A-like protein 1
MRLHPYQEQGRNFLAARRRAYLGDVMGLGKSAQAITAARLVNAKRPLIVCPASAVPNWQAEWEKWNGPGTPEILSYSSLIRRKPDHPDVLILDEAHYAKSPSAKRTKAALGLGQKADYTWLLSGTPMPNNPTELWPPIKYLWPEIAEEVGCRTAEDWMFRFCRVRNTQYGPKPYAVRDGPLLRSIVQRIMLRRTIDDVGIELPPLRVELHRLPADAAAQAAMAEYAALEADEDSYSATLRRVLGAAKAPAVARQIVEELNDGAYRKVVVLYYHRAVGDLLFRLFEEAGHVPVGFHGGTPQDARWKAIQTFQEQPGNPRVFLGQQVAAGIAIDLAAASEIVLLEPAWTPDENSQAIARIRSLSKQDPCRARIFALAGTLDMQIMSTIRSKVKMQREVL